MTRVPLAALAVLSLTHAAGIGPAISQSYSLEVAPTASPLPAYPRFDAARPPTRPGAACKAAPNPFEVTGDTIRINEPAPTCATKGTK